MSNQPQAVLGIAVILLGGYMLRNIWKVRKATHELFASLDAKNDQIAYLINLLEKYDVPLDEFDAIAFKNLQAE